MSFSQVKRYWQEKIFKNISQSKVVTTGGPELEIGIKVFPSKVKEFIIYETNFQLFCDSCKKYYGKYKILCKNIFDAEVEQNTFYSFDMYGTYPKISNQLKRFKDNKFSLTVSLRNFSRKKTIKSFVKSLDEKIISEEYKKGHPSVIVTNKNKYIYIVYVGKKGPMFFLYKM